MTTLDSSGVHAAVRELQRLALFLNRPLNIIETGTLRSEKESFRIGDGYSTLHIAEWIRTSRIAHMFYSIDIDPDNLTCCYRVLYARGLTPYVNLCKGDSAEVLSGFQFAIDFAYLDSCKEPEQNLKEFRAVDASGALVVVIDDVYNCEDNVNKGRLTIPVALQMGYTCEPALDRLAVLRRKK